MLLHQQTKPALRQLPGQTASPAYGPRVAREYSLRDFLSVLFKRRRTILVFFGAVVATVVFGLVTKRPTYEATAAILVKKAKTEMPLTPSRSEPIVTMVSEEDLNSEIEILKSRRVIEEALQALPAPSTSQGAWARAKASVKNALGMASMSAQDRRVLAVERDLAFSVIARSNIVELRYSAEDPVLAADVLTALIDTYLEYRIQVHALPQAVSFFDEQTETARQRLTNAEDALERYIQDAGVSMPLNDQKLLALQALDEFERALAQASVSVQEGENRVAALDQRLRGEPERLPSSYRMNQSSETEELRRALVELRLRRDDLLTRGFSPGNVRVRDVEAQIGLAEGRLADAEERVGDINQTEINALHQDLKSRLLIAQADLAADRARLEALGQRVAGFQRSLDQLNQKSFEIVRLNREATAAEDAYLLYRQKHEEAQISVAMDQQKMVNVGVAREPRPPLTPSGPSKMSVLAVALILGSIGAIAVAFTLEFLDHSLMTGDDLERRVGIPHLASIPDVDPAFSGSVGLARIEAA